MYKSLIMFMYIIHIQICIHIYPYVRRLYGLKDNICTYISILPQPTNRDRLCTVFDIFSIFYTQGAREKLYIFLQFAASLLSAARDEYSYTAGHFPTTIHSPLPAKGESILLNFYWKKSNLFKPPCS